MTAFNLNTRAARSMFALALLAVVASLYALAAQGGVPALSFDFGGGVAHLAGMFGLSFGAAQRIINVILTAWSIWAAIAAIVAITGGAGIIGVGIIASAKAIAKRYGARYAAAW